MTENQTQTQTPPTETSSSDQQAAPQATPESTLLVEGLDVNKGSETKTEEPGGAKTETDVPDVKPDSPDGYEFTLPKGFEADKEIEAAYRKSAHELGLTKTQAQKLTELYATNLTRQTEKIQAAQVEMFNKTLNEWTTEIKNRPEFVADKKLAQSALAKFGDQELFQLFDRSGLGSHPKFFDFMTKVGRALAEPGFHGKSSPPPTDEPLYKRLHAND